MGISIKSLKHACRSGIPNTNDGQFNRHLPSNSWGTSRQHSKPLHFNNFLNDICNIFTNTNTPSIFTLKVPCLLYADDLLIMSTASEGLQNSLNKLSNYCEEWGIDVNAQKSNIIDFSRKKNNDRVMFTLNNSQLKCVNNYNYLGFNINSNGKLDLLQKTLVNNYSIKRPILIIQNVRI